MKAAFTGIAVEAAIAFAPAFTAVADWVKSAVQAVGTFADNYRSNLDIIFNWLFENWNAILSDMMNSWSILVGNLATNFVVGLKAMLSAFQSFNGYVVIMLQNLASGNWQGLMLDELFGAMQASIQRDLEEGLVGALEGFTRTTPEMLPLRWDVAEPPVAPTGPGPVDVRATRQAGAIDLGIDRLLDAFRQQPQWEDIRVGAAERGSQEAFSAIMNTQKKIEEQHFEEAKRQTQLLQAISATKITLAITSMMHP
jgi:hypothetical protein